MWCGQLEQNLVCMQATWSTQNEEWIGIRIIMFMILAVFFYTTCATRGTGTFRKSKLTVFATISVLARFYRMNQ
jgi:hypothetical protein